MRDNRFVVLFAVLWACTGKVGAGGTGGAGGTARPPGSGGSSGGSIGEGAGGGAGAGGRAGEGACASGTGTAAEETLMWKRGAALAADLGRALALNDAELCTEVSDVPCVDVHRAPLGRSDPFGTGLLSPASRPMATTALATERVALSACSTRVEKDRAGSPQVFEGIDLSDQPLSADLAAQRAAAEQLAKTLYPRLLSRTATPAEVDVLRELAIGSTGQPVSARSFAKLACFAIATTTEFVLY